MILLVYKHMKQTYKYNSKNNFTNIDLYIHDEKNHN